MQKSFSNTEASGGARILLCGLICCAAMAVTGCPHAAPAPKYAWRGIARPPVPVTRGTEEAPLLEANADQAQTTLPVVITIPPERPAPPHRAAPPEPEPAKPPSAPQISPQLAPQDQARAQSDAEADLNTARQNLNSVAGRQMNSTQQDLADKIRSFMAQAREAVTAGDWLTAKNLAEKARVLSEELVHSF